MTEVVMENVFVSYERPNEGRKEVLVDLTFRVKSGNIAALVGRNGSGKTSLLRVVAGLLAADAGRISFGDLKKPKIGWVPQDYRSALYPWLSVERNLLLGFDYSEAETLARRTAREILSTSKISLDDRPFKLSGGQQQIITVLRAFLRPGLNLLLLDEPFSALDVEHRAQLRDSLRALVISSGVTAIFVSHDLLDATLISDSISILGDGGIRRSFDILGETDTGTERRRSGSEILEMVQLIERELRVD